MPATAPLWPLTWLSTASIICGAIPISAMPVATERRISWITQLVTPERLSSSSLQVLHAGDLKTPSPLRGDFSKRARAVGANGTTCARLFLARSLGSWIASAPISLQRSSLISLRRCPVESAA